MPDTPPGRSTITPGIGGQCQRPGREREAGVGEAALLRLGVLPRRIARRAVQAGGEGFDGWPFLVREEKEGLGSDGHDRASKPSECSGELGA